MFQKVAPKSYFGSAISISELIYHSIVRSIRNTHGNAVMSILLNLTQLIVMVIAFYVMMNVLGMRRSAIRGDFLLYIMSGIFLYMTHIKAVGATAGAEGATSGMMKHAPMNTIISISASALSSLYIQVLSMAVILFVYFNAVSRFEIDLPIQAFGMLLLAWFSGIALGLVFLALKPWFPVFTGLLVTIYTRASMIASGKMFVANSLPGWMLAMFDWNPLFHVIDQCRGFIFLNYSPHHSSLSYPIKVSLVLVVIGMMGEFYTRRHVSASWSARR